MALDQSALLDLLESSKAADIADADDTTSSGRRLIVRRRSR